MNTVTKRIVLVAVALLLGAAVSASALPRRVVVVPRFEVRRPLVYDRYWGPWGPAYAYPYGYAYPYYNGTADIRTDVTPKNAEVFIDGYYAGHARDFDGTFKGLNVVPGGHLITLHLDGFRTLTEDVYVRPASTFKMKATMERLVAGEMSAPVPAPLAAPGHPATD